MANYTKLIEVEDALIQALSSSGIVDGHDAGAEQVNIFIQTDKLHEAFNTAKLVLGNQRAWERVRVAYRSLEEDTYVVLWPKGLAIFDVT